MKLREAIAWRREEMVLDGEVEIDGKYAGGHICPENKGEDRIGRRRKKYQNIKSLCALAIRQRGLGGQTFTRNIRDEDSNAAWAAVRSRSQSLSTAQLEDQLCKLLITRLKAGKFFSQRQCLGVAAEFESKLYSCA